MLSQSFIEHLCIVLAELCLMCADNIRLMISNGIADTLFMFLNDLNKHA